MIDEEKRLRTLIARDFSASRMSKTKWWQLLYSLKNLPLRQRYKVIDSETVFEGILVPRTLHYLDGPSGPVLALALVWVEIDPIEFIERGMLLENELVDHTDNVERILHGQKVDYEQQGLYLRIVGYVR